MNTEFCSRPSCAIDAARRLLNTLDSNSAPVDVHELALRQGITRIKLDQMSESGYLMDLGRLEIHVNANHSRSRQRFTICHELAHSFFLSIEEQKRAHTLVRIEHSHLENCLERLCDIAATELLMPATLFSRIAKELRPGVNSLQILSKTFGVSEEAALNRLNEVKASWNCAVVRWKPIRDCCGMTTGFEVVKHRIVGDFDHRVFGINTKSAKLDGLFRTLRTGLLANDYLEGYRIESRAMRNNNEVIILSIVATSDEQERFVL